MEQPPPLTPEEMSQLSSKEYAQLGQPQVVKVFGILHLVFGAYGILVSLWTLFVIIAGNPFLKFSGNTPDVQIQTQLEADMIGYTIVSTGLYMIVTALIMIAGVLLVKGRKNALKWSNYYAWTSIFTKIINIIATVFYILPMTKEIMNEVAPAGGPLMGTMEIWMTVSMIVVSVVPLVYPVLTLILLNRPYVKTWFTNQPS